jgi:hypothetical protein
MRPAKGRHRAETDVFGPNYMRATVARMSRCTLGTASGPGSEA